MTAPMETQVEVEQVPPDGEPVALHPVADTDDATAGTEPPRIEASETDPGELAREDSRAGLNDARETARAVWRKSVALGDPLTGRELGARFGLSERWGRDRVAEVRHADGIGGGTPRRRRRTPRGTAADTVAGTARGTGTAGGPARQDDVPEPPPGSGGVVAGREPAAEPTPARQPDAVPPAQQVPDVPAVSVLPAGARLVAWAGFLFGTVISVAANVLYAWLPTMTGETASAPGLAPQIGAAVWPIALVISVEVLSRVPWRPGWAWQVARYGGAGVVALGAAVISYGHLRGVLAAWGYGTTGAAVGPLVVDGLMTISGFALLAMGDHGKRAATSGKAVA